MLNPQHLSTYTYKDASRETSSFTVNRAASADSTAHNAFATAVATIANGELVTRRDTSATKISNARSGSGNREDKWLVIFNDAVTLAEYSTEIPCRDTTLAMIADSDRAALDTEPWAAFVTAFQAYVLSPDGNAVEVIEIRLVGRNL